MRWFGTAFGFLLGLQCNCGAPLAARSWFHHAPLQSLASSFVLMIHQEKERNALRIGTMNLGSGWVFATGKSHYRSRSRTRTFNCSLNSIHWDPLDLKVGRLMWKSVQVQPFGPDLDQGFGSDPGERRIYQRVWDIFCDNWREISVIQ